MRLRALWRRFHDSQPQVAEALVEPLGENAVVVMEQKVGTMVSRHGLPQLLLRPRRRGMCRHIGMQNAVGRVFHDDKDIEQAKGRRDDDAEVARDDGLGMIADKRSVPVSEAPYRLCLEGRTQASPRSPTYGRNRSPRSHLTDAGEMLD
jgi:hypothetical protein